VVHGRRDGADTLKDAQETSMIFNVNDRRHDVDVSGDMPLLSTAIRISADSN
jgi:hypothetical protein